MQPFYFRLRDVSLFFLVRRVKRARDGNAEGSLLSRARARSCTATLLTLNKNYRLLTIKCDLRLEETSPGSLLTYKASKASL